MAAGDHLGTQFFHGSTAHLQPGDIVHSGAEVGNRNYEEHARWRTKHVWATPDESGAWSYAQKASWFGGESSKGRRPRVFEVEPIGPTQKRRRLSTSDPEEHTMRAARVKRVINTPPGKQGELPLPHEDWDHYKTMLTYKGDEPLPKGRFGQEWTDRFERHRTWAYNNDMRSWDLPEEEEFDPRKPGSNQRRMF